MIVFSDRVFDERIEGPTLGTPPYYTSIDYATTLAKGDLIAIMVIVDDVTNMTVSPTITVAFEHSNDGVQWSPKRGTAEIPATSIPSVDTNVYYYSEPRFGNVPSLKYVRFNTSVTGFRGTYGPHVEIFATVRDRRGSATGAPTPDVTYGSAWQNARRQAQAGAEIEALKPRRALAAFHLALQRAGGNHARAIASLDSSTRMELEEFAVEVRRRSTQPYGRAEGGG